MAIPTDLGRRIRSRRIDLGIKSCADLAERARLPYSTLAGIENGDTRSASHEVLKPISKVLQVSTDWLLDVDQTPPGPDRVGELLHPREEAVLRAFRSASPTEKKQIEAFLAAFAIRQAGARRQRLSVEPRPPPRKTATR